jgi:hypothetical protein
MDEASEMSIRGEDAPRAERRLRLGAWAAWIAGLGLALFLWPFLRTPLLGIGASYAHLLGAWAIVIVALALLSRAIGREVRGRDGRA